MIGGVVIDPVSDVFFQERAGRAPGERRSLARACLFAAELGLDLGGLHPLVVVGSKGKGTAATYAAATVHAYGMKVGLITSPGYRTHYERMRVDGVAICPHEFERLAGRVATALGALPRREPGSGYVSPTGTFTIAGLSWLVEQGCEALVVEAGMGGRSDESSLTQPSVVAFTEIFEEHVGLLGDNLVEIATDKAGAVSADTKAVLSLPQEPRVHMLIDDAARPSASRLTFIGDAVVNGLPQLDIGDAVVNGLPQLDKLPTLLLRRNAALGVEAGRAYVDILGGTTSPTPFPDVVLPGRLSVHHRAGQTWVVDSAISAPGVRTALEWCRSALGEPSTILLSIPTSKDLAACREALDHANVGILRVDTPHLAFAPTDDATPPPTLADLNVDELGPLVLTLGTISFAGDVLTLLDVDTTRLF